MLRLASIARSERFMVMMECSGMSFGKRLKVRPGLAADQ
jgi:hypothetical protein